MAASFAFSRATRLKFANNTPTIPYVTDRRVLVSFRIGTNAEQFYISARIQMNFRDNFILLTVI
jgi:hypothetical protein